MNVHLSRILCLSLITLLLGAGLALAAQEKLRGTIESVDLDRGMFTLTTTEGARQFSASPAMMQELTAGDTVNVVVEGNVVRFIVDKNDPEQQESKKSNHQDEDSK